MNKKQIKILMREKRNEMRTLQGKSNSINNVEELRQLNTQLNKLNNEMNDLEVQLDTIEDEEEARNAIDPNIAAMPPTNLEPRNQPQLRSQPQGQLNIIGTYSMGDINNSNQRSDTTVNKEEIQALYEKRGQDLKDKKSVSFDFAELRSVTIASGQLITPTQDSAILNTAFNEVSSVIDLVNNVPLMGGEAYKKGFVKGYGEGGETAENIDYTDADPIMDYVTIGKCKITAYSELSEEAVKLTNVNYQAEVAKGINIAIRKKIAKQILIGVGGENQIKGIFNAPVNVMPVAGDLSIKEINADTLDTLVFGYGGDEDIEGNCYLILNKKDLAAFAAIRTATGEKLYKITLNGNTGTISSSDSYAVNFIINSACPQLSAIDTVVGTYCMAYGKLKGFELPTFSPVDVQESREFKFKSGQVCYKGSVYVGGSVAMYKAFTRIKKSA